MVLIVSVSGHCLPFKCWILFHYNRHVKAVNERFQKVRRERIISSLSLTSHIWDIPKQHTHSSVAAKLYAA